MEMLLSAATQACTLITLNYIVSKAKTRFYIERGELLIVPLFTGFASICMILQPFPGSILLPDLRYIPIIMAGLRYGTIAAARSVILPVLFLILVHGDPAWTALQGFIVPILLTSIHYLDDRKDPFAPVPMINGVIVGGLLFAFHTVIALFIDQVTIMDWLSGVVSVNIVVIATLIVLIIMMNDENKAWVGMRRMELKAHQDSLTRLPNFRSFATIVKSTLMMKRVSILMIDIDSFKNYNDNWGHQQGDQLLYEVGMLLQQSIGEKDYVARYGGEEFIMMCNDSTESQVLKTAEKLCKTVAAYPFSGKDVQPNGYISISIGIAIASSPNDNLNRLIRGADLALYESKRKGKNTYSLYAAHHEQLDSVTR